MLRIKVVVSIGIAFALAAGLIYVNESRTVRLVTNGESAVRIEQAQVSLEQRRSLRNFSILERSEAIAEYGGIVRELNRLAEPIQVEPEGDDDALKKAEDKKLVDVHKALEQELAAAMAGFKSVADVKDRSNLMYRITSAPDYIAVVDGDGRVLAEKGTYRDKWDRIEDRVLSIVRNPKNMSARDSRLDVWFLGVTPITVGLAPVVQAGKTIGGVIVGHSLNNEAKTDSVALGVDVVYHVKAVNTQGQTRNFLRTTVTNGMTNAVERFFEDKNTVRRAAPKRSRISNQGGSESRAIVYQVLPGFLSAEVVVGVITNPNSVLRQASESQSMIFLACFFGALLAVGLCLVVLANFFRPIEALDQGVLELLNGNLDYWFATESEEMTSRMGQNLNILVCQLSGRPLPPDEDSVGAGDWVNDQLFVEDFNPEELADANAELVPSDKPSGTYSLSMLRVLNDPDDVYLRKTFSDYVEALEKSGQPRGGLTFQLFETELNKKATKIQETLKCRELRFIVEVENGRASLRPVPIG